MNILHVGLDVGSTTVKIIVMNEEKEVIYSMYGFRKFIKNVS